MRLIRDESDKSPRTGEATIVWLVEEHRPLFAIYPAEIQAHLPIRGITALKLALMNCARSTCTPVIDLARFHDKSAPSANRELSRTFMYLGVSLVQ